MCMSLSLHEYTYLDMKPGGLVFDICLDETKNMRKQRSKLLEERTLYILIWNKAASTISSDCFYNNNIAEC